MLRKLLVVCGPTATGKTRLALSLAKALNGEIVSADSKQVYRGLNIGTGKDIPPDAKKEGFYLFNGVKIWGYDLAGPKEEFSVSRYLGFAQRKIEEIISANKLPILVGGTGFYIKSIVDGISTLKIPRSKNLRKNLEGKTQDELFELLAQLDSIKAGGLNASDKKNPRRLARAIEIATWKLKGQKIPGEGKIYTKLFIGLTAPKEDLFKKIKKRVDERIDVGIEKEIRRLLKSGVNWTDQSMSSLGYRQWKSFFEGKKDKAQTIKDWVNEERKYAKRQITWFKKDKRINWFDITTPNWQERVERLVKKWYSSSHAEKD